MVSKATALSKANRGKLIEETLYRAAAHLAMKVTKASALQSDLKRRCIVPGQRHEIDCPAQSQCAVFQCISAAKNFRMTERIHVKIFQNGFPICLIVAQAVEQKRDSQRFVLGRNTRSADRNLRNLGAIFRLKENARCSLQQIFEV